MCRTRQEIIDDEPEVQKLIKMKESLEAGRTNGFSPDRLHFELTKLESQIESVIREFIQADRQAEQAELLTHVEVKLDKRIDDLKDSMETGFEKHYSFHRKNPSLIALFKKSPTGIISLGGAGLTASSLLYIKETRDVIFKLIGMDSLAGQELVVIGFPLFIFLLITGIIALTNSRHKNDPHLTPKKEGE